MKRKKLSATVPLFIDKHSSPLTTSWQTNRRQITAPQLQTTPQLQEAPFPIESSSPPLTPLHGVVRHPRTTSTRIWNCHLCILSDTPNFEFCHTFPASFMLSPRLFINSSLRHFARQTAPRNQFIQAFGTTSRIMAQEYKLKGLSSIDLKPGEKREVEVEGIEEGKVLLLNVGGKVTAVGNKCTHYGAPLVKGVLTGKYLLIPSNVRDN